MSCGLFVCQREKRCGHLIYEPKNPLCIRARVGGGGGGGGGGVGGGG